VRDVWCDVCFAGCLLLSLGAVTGQSLGRTVLLTQLDRSFLFVVKARRSKKRKRGESGEGGANDKRKRSHTGYTLFVHENYETIKKSHQGSGNGAEPPMNSKEIMSLVARQWSEAGDEERQTWQDRAERLKEAEVAEASSQPNGDMPTAG